MCLIIFCKVHVFKILKLLQIKVNEEKICGKIKFSASIIWQEFFLKIILELLETIKLMFLVYHTTIFASIKSEKKKKTHNDVNKFSVIKNSEQSN